jgi:hypothetical protein
MKSIVERAEPDVQEVESCPDLHREFIEQCVPEPPELLRRRIDRPRTIDLNDMSLMLDEAGRQERPSMAVRTATARSIAGVGNRLVPPRH